MAGSSIQRVLVFGDECVDKLVAVQEIYDLSGSNPVLRNFLQQAVTTIQSEVSDLRPEERSYFASYEDILNLAEGYAAQKPLPPIVGDVLLFVVQIGHLIVRAEQDPLIFARDNVDRIHILGLCVGLPAACIAAVARNVPHAIELAVTTLGVAVRFGAALHRRSQLIEEHSGAWASTIVSSQQDVEQLLQKVNHSLPVVRHAYAGVISENWTTIFAPSSTKSLLAGSLKSMSSSPHATASCVHASHLAPIDLDQIIGSHPALEASVLQPSIFSTSSLAPFSGRTFKNLLTLALQDISEKPLLMDRSIEALSASLKHRERVLLTPIGPTVHTALIKRLLENDNSNVEVFTAGEAVDQFENTSQDRIAIVSMSGRFPGAESIEDFWRLLLAGETTHSSIPSSRFTSDDPILKRLSGCFLSNPGLFDNEFFKMSPSEAMQVDPIQRMLLMVVYEALQMAGFVPNSSPSTRCDRIATFIGQTTSDWLGINDQQGVGTHYVPGSLRAFAAGRLNNFFGWGGGYSSIDTACSSSLTAVHMACQALKNHECDMSVAGGGAIHMLPEMFEGLNNGGFLSATGGCKSFHDDADGYCRGEAVAAVVLKRLEDAQREGHPILAVIRGSARNSNAGSSRSIAAPGGKAQQRLFQQILREARVHPNEVNAVEMHAPGTQAGDTVEMESVVQVFSANGRTAENPLYATSVKANIGHGEAAAGIVNLIKAVLMLRKETIPPQPGRQKLLNKAFGSSLSAANVTIPNDAVPWHTKDRQRKILVNSFDAAGGNVSALLEEFPNAEKNSKAPSDRRTHHVVVVSARSAKALAINKARLRDALLANAYVPIADVAYTLTARRVHESAWRQSYVVETVDDLVAALIADSGSPRSTLNEPQRCSVFFAFTGQGVSYGGMGRELYRTNSTVRNLLDWYQATCHAEKLGSFISYLLDEDGSSQATEATETTRQTALVALEIAIAQYFQILDIRPTVVVGHSLGEYAALCIAGVLSVIDTLRLVHQRAQLMERLLTAGTHGMLSTGVSRSQFEALLAALDGACEIACINSPTSTVIGGPKVSLEALQAICNDRGTPSKFLPVQHAYHAAQMDVVLDEFRECAEGAQFHPPRIPVASPSCGGTANKFDADYLCRHLRQAVDFLGAIRCCENEHIIAPELTVFEIGSHPVCNSLISQSLQSTRPTFTASLQRGVPQWYTVSQCLARSYEVGIDIEWRAFHRPYVANLKQVDLPTYGWDLKDFWVPHRGRGSGNIKSQVLNNSERIASCLHYLHSKEEDHEGRMTIIFKTDTAEEQVFRMIKGHEVDDVPICPASVFMNIAYTSAAFVFKADGKVVKSDEMHLQDVSMTSPLALPDRASAPVIWITARQSGTNVVNIVFASGTDRSIEHQHGSCRITTAHEASWISDWSRMQRLIYDRTKALRADSTGHRMTALPFYALFSQVVIYEDTYRTMDEVYVADDFHDAVAVVKIPPKTGADELDIHSPHVLDAFVHLAGFLLNARPGKDDNDLYIAHHIGNVDITEVMTTQTDGKRTNIYASVRGSSVAEERVCDAYVFDDDSKALMVSCSDIRFRKLDRTAFYSLTMQSNSNHFSYAPKPKPLPQLGLDSPVNKEKRETSPRLSRSSAETLLECIASELGVDSNDLAPSKTFDSLGLDSLKSIKLLGTFARKTGIQLPAAFFTHHNTVAAARAAVDEVPNAVLSQQTTNSSNISSRDETPLPSSSTSRQESPVQRLVSQSNQLIPELERRQGNARDSHQVVPEPRVVLIQGSSDSRAAPLFLAAAGVGLIAPYIHFPPFPDDRRVYALESPFLDCPELYNGTVEEMAINWIPAIRKIQPHGPYLLGGYSAGAVFAYEIARRLTADYNERIVGLVLIDMRVPRRCPKIEQVLVSTLLNTGMLDGLGDMTPSNKLHSAQTSRAIAGYEPIPFEQGKQPALSHVIWAGRGFAETTPSAMYPVGHGKPYPPSEMDLEAYIAEFRRWFTGKREDFGSNGWEAYVGDHNIGVSVVQQANHCTIVEQPLVKELGEILVRVLGEIEELV